MKNQTTPCKRSPGEAAQPRRFQQIVSLILSVALLSLNACTTTSVTHLEAAKVVQPVQERIVGVTLKDGTEVAFDSPGGTLQPTRVTAKVKAQPYDVALTDVQRVWVERTSVSTGRTVGLIAGVVVAGLVIALASKQSCPFVYSWDGRQFVFDAEPYGGAITRGLERSDFSELTNLREQEGSYRLLVTNEVDETQYTNLMELWVVDHAPGARVVSDEYGRLRAFHAIHPPTTARDRQGVDLRAWLTATDLKIWEPASVPGPDGSLRQEVILTFPKPAGVTQVTLVANAATGLWGSYMIKKMTELRGREAGLFLGVLDRDPAAVQALHAWGEREETYRLRVEVEEPTGWEVRGTLVGGGPFLAEDRAIALDVSRVRGSELRVRLRPPVGFWALNSFGLAHGEGEAVAIKTVAMQSARTFDGKDVRPDLVAVDDKYYRMPELTDRAEVVFSAPPRLAGKDRTVFLHSRGWYELHLRADGPPDQATLARISNTPDGAAQFAAEQFAAWRRMATPQTLP